MVVVDFPDPSNFSIGKLYSKTFYSILKTVVAPDGIAVIQSTSPFVAPKSFWCIDTTIRDAGMLTKAYHNMVPSFGEWGYIMAMNNNTHQWFASMPANLRFLNNETMQQMFVFPEDMKVKQPLQVNKLNNQALVGYFEAEWDRYLDL